MVTQLTGKLDFFPDVITKKHDKQASWKRVAMIRTSCDVDDYYAWFLKKRFNLTLNPSIRGAHVTIINDKMDFDMFEEAAGIFHGKDIDFYVELEPRSNGEHWWLRVHCPDGENIRQALGLSPQPYSPFHLTLGYANERNIAHSEYILEQCKRFELTSNESRNNKISGTECPVKTYR